MEAGAGMDVNGADSGECYGADGCGAGDGGGGGEGGASVGT